MSSDPFLRLLDTRDKAELAPAHQRPLPHLIADPEREQWRKLPFETMHNFRDLGGYCSADGRPLRWGRLYRSDKIAGLSAEDIKYLKRLNLQRIVDFRSPEEVQSNPHSLWPDAEVAIHLLPVSVEAANIDKLTARLTEASVSADEMADFLVAANREMIERFTPTFRQWMQSLLEEDFYPQVFHCSAGKDRTGLAAALVLHAVGVADDVIMQDYLATNAYTEGRVRQILNLLQDHPEWQRSDAALGRLMRAAPEFINAAYAVIDSDYGSIDHYLQRGLGIGDSERQRLRALLLEGGEPQP